MSILYASLTAHPRMEFTQMRVPAQPNGITRHTLADAVPRGRLLMLIILDNVTERDLCKFNAHRARPLEPCHLRAYPLRDAEGRECQVISLDRQMGLVPHDTVIIGHTPDPNLELVT